jgi:hypothetical protein
LSLLLSHFRFNMAFWKHTLVDVKCKMLKLTGCSSRTKGFFEKSTFLVKAKCCPNLHPQQCLLFRRQVGCHLMLPSGLLQSSAVRTLAPHQWMPNSTVSWSLYLSFWAEGPYLHLFSGYLYLQSPQIQHVQSKTPDCDTKPSPPHSGILVTLLRVFPHSSFFLIPSVSAS